MNDSLGEQSITKVNIVLPLNKSGMHLAVPVGFPANYIEYIFFNKSVPNWSGDRLKQLREAAVCDGHPIPLVSVNTFAVI